VNLLHKYRSLSQRAIQSVNSGGFGLLEVGDKVSIFFHFLRRKDSCSSMFIVFSFWVGSSIYLRN
jgi:hypothetical protein